jgi:hypothetical protein
VIYVACFVDERLSDIGATASERKPYMYAKLFAVVFGVVFVFAVALAGSQANAHTHHRHVVRTFVPGPQYVRVVVKALFDSCWRYREIRTARGRELERIWTCGDYVKPNAEFDWTYGSSIADRAERYGYR